MRVKLEVNKYFSEEDFLLLALKHFLNQTLLKYAMPVSIDQNCLHPTF